MTTALVGCDSGDGVPRAASLAAMGEQVAAVQCSRIFECDPGAVEFFQTQATCREFFVGLSQISDDFVKLGWAEFDQEAGGACVAATRTQMTTLSCDELDTAPPIPACDKITTPLQGEMEPCGRINEDGSSISFDFVCLDGRLCETVTADEPPVCVTPTALGEACGGDARGCARDAYCNYADNPPVCVAVTPLGAACSGFDECGADGNCNDDGICESF
ncbi:MAG: hypothetical protein ACI9U2_004277 [Bradymonadia bacterium]|jgi:hypothetical protein